VHGPAQEDGCCTFSRLPEAQARLAGRQRLRVGKEEAVCGQMETVGAVYRLDRVLSRLRTEKHPRGVAVLPELVGDGLRLILGARELAQDKTAQEVRDVAGKDAA